MNPTNNRPVAIRQSTARTARPQSRYMRIPPGVRQEIERMARAGHNDADIARQCAVTRETAHRYGTNARPKPDYHVHLDERQLRIMARLAEMAVEVRCNRCRILVLGFMFLPITRCTRCGSQIAIPLTVGSV